MGVLCDKRALMRVELLVVEQLRAQIPVMTKEMFAEQYPCIFLLAMGFLSVEEQREEASKNEDFTSPIIIGGPRRHDARKEHPLAGCAFALRRRSQQTEHVKIGRSATCEITVPDTTVSDQHCLISWTQDNLFLTDTGSTNGTTVNLDPLQVNRPQVIHPEDIITLGRYSFQLHSPETLFESLRMLDLLND